MRLGMEGMKFSSFHCFLNCCFSWRGRCTASSEKTWLNEYERSFQLWKMGFEEEATIPKDCPIFQQKLPPPWEEKVGGKR